MCEGSELIRIATEQMASAPTAVMPGAVSATLSNAKDRLEKSGSCLVLMRARSTRCLLAWASVVIEDAMDG